MLGHDWLMLKHQPITTKHSAFCPKLFSVINTGPRFSYCRSIPRTPHANWESRSSYNIRWKKPFLCLSMSLAVYETNCNHLLSLLGMHIHIKENMSRHPGTYGSWVIYQIYQWKTKAPRPHHKNSNDPCDLDLEMVCDTSSPHGKKK